MIRVNGYSVPRGSNTIHPSFYNKPIIPFIDYFNCLLGFLHFNCAFCIVDHYGFYSPDQTISSDQISIIPTRQLYTLIFIQHIFIMSYNTHYYYYFIDVFLIVIRSMVPSPTTPFNFKNTLVPESNQTKSKTALERDQICHNLTY